MVDQIDLRKHLSLSSGINKMKQAEWQKVTKVVKVVSSEQWTLDEIKNKLSDFKCEAKCITVHSESVRTI